MGERLNISNRDSSAAENAVFFSSETVSPEGKRNTDFKDYSNQVIKAAKDGRVSEKEAIGMMAKRLIDRYSKTELEPQIGQDAKEEWIGSVDKKTADDDDLTSIETAPKLSYEKLSEEDAKAIIDRTTFKDEDDKEYVEKWATPKYAAELKDGTKMYFSDFSEQFERPFIVNYVEDKENDTLRARLYYVSNSAGLWRFCPRISRNMWGGYWIDKGPWEDAMNAPFEVQKVLDQLYEHSNDASSENSSEGAMNGTKKQVPLELAKCLDFNEDLSEMVFWRENLTNGGYGMLVAPESCKIKNDALLPDYSHEVDSWEKESALIGEKITNHCFESKDGSLEYLMSQTKDGRVWVAAVECQDCETNSLGLKSQYVVPGSLSVPLYEYSSQACGYGNRNDIKGSTGEYVAMDDYINQIPMIEEFYKTFKKSS